jgi:hypothetical protein
LLLLADYLMRHQIGPVQVLYDAPLSFSGKLAQRTEAIWSGRGLTVAAQAVPVPEKDLAGFSGAIATSDTALIDAHPVIVDLAGEIIAQEVTGQIVNL